jgi:type VI protein secretion system component VasK
VAASSIAATDVSDRDFAKVAKILDQAHDISQPYDNDMGHLFGLPTQDEKLLSGSRGLYIRALNDLLLPRILLQVETDMRTQPTDASYVTDSARIYPMLGGRTEIDASFARKMLAEDMERALPGTENTNVRSALDLHVKTLVTEPLTPIALDDELIADALAAEQARERFSKWAVNGGELCVTGLADRYPFAKDSAVEVTVTDFTALFGPGGAFDRFFRENLQAKVDTKSVPWQWKDAAEHSVETVEGLKAFERAAAIRSAFFASNSVTPSVAFEVTPLLLEGDALGVVLASDGQQVIYSKGVQSSVRPIAMFWPGQLGIKGAELSFQPLGASRNLSKGGGWAIFRLLDAGDVQSLDDGGVRAAFRFGTHNAAFEFHVDTPFNPFNLTALRAFRCPKSL